MFRKIIFYDNFTDAMTNTWATLMTQGVLLVLLGIAVLVAPELLVAMVAASLIVPGIFCIVFAFKSRRLRQQYRSWREQFWEPL